MSSEQDGAMCASDDAKYVMRVSANSNASAVILWIILLMGVLALVGGAASIIYMAVECIYNSAMRHKDKQHRLDTTASPPAADSFTCWRHVSPEDGGYTVREQCRREWRQ